MSIHKGIKMIIIAAAIIAVFGVGILILAKFVPEKPDPNVSPEPTEAPPAVYIVNEDPEAMTRMETVFADGGFISVDYSTGEDGKLMYNIIPPASYFAYNTSKFRSMRYTTSNMTAKAVVEENAKDWTKYGLDEPSAIVTLIYENGKTIKVSIGDQASINYDYYARTDQDNNVYLLGNYLVSLMMRDEKDYRSIATFPTYTEDDIYTNIDWVRLTKRDGMVLEIQGNSEIVIEDNVSMSFYMLLSPVHASGNDDIIRSSIMDVVAQIRYINIDNDIDNSKLGEYGLDKPARFEMRDVEGNMIDIMVGKMGGNGSYYYCADADQYRACVEDNEPLTVLLYATEAFGWMDINYMTLVNRAAWIQNIRSVAAVDYEYFGESYHLELSEYDDVTDSGVEVVRTVGKLSGTGIDGVMDISEDDTKRLYARSMNLRVIGDIPKDANLGKADCVITFTLKNGGKRVMELIPLNDRQYAAQVDGVAEHYIYASNIQNFIRAIERIKDKRPVELVYYT